MGAVREVNTDLLHSLLDIGICPVVLPIGTGLGDERYVAYNVNADVAAGRIAGELRAARTISATSTTSEDDTLIPPSKLDSTPTLFSMDAICGPPAVYHHGPHSEAKWFTNSSWTR